MDCTLRADGDDSLGGHIRGAGSSKKVLGLVRAGCAREARWGGEPGRMAVNQTATGANRSRSERFAEGAGPCSTERAENAGWARFLRARSLRERALQSRFCWRSCSRRMPSELANAYAPGPFPPISGERGARRPGLSPAPPFPRNRGKGGWADRGHAPSRRPRPARDEQVHEARHPQREARAEELEQHEGREARAEHGAERVHAVEDGEIAAAGIVVARGGAGGGGERAARLPPAPPTILN